MSPDEYEVFSKQDEAKIEKLEQQIESLSKRNAELEKEIPPRDLVWITREELKSFEGIIELAKAHLSFDRGQYIYDKEAGNLVCRNQNTVALLEALSQLGKE